MFLQDDLISNLVRALYTVQRKNMSVLFILIFTLFCNVFSSSTVTNVRDTSHELAVLKRDKRWLVWKEGINWVAVIFFYYIFFMYFLRICRVLSAKRKHQHSTSYFSANMEIA